jgi:hypothetical protein
MLVLDMIEILPPLGKYKYYTSRILSVKCYINNSGRVRSCIRNVSSLLQLWWWALSNPPAAPPKGTAIDVFFSFSDGHCRTHQQHPQGVHHRLLLQLRTWPLLDPPTAPPMGPPLTTSPTSMVAATGPVGSTPKGAAIDVFFNFGGGRYRTHRQHPPRGPQSTSSSTLVVAAARPVGSTPKGPAIDVFFNFGGGRYRTRR